MNIPMQALDEMVNPREQAIIDLTIELMLARREKNFKPGTLAKRALHGKSLGCVDAIFTVKELPAELRVGLFATPGRYPAVMRFSNGAFGAGFPDILPNVRGVAFKVRDVPGVKLMTGEHDSTEVDFVMANERTFFVPTIDDAFSLAQFKIFELLTRSPGTIFRALAASSKYVGSLLQIDYFSQVPYRFGDRACKFALTPSSRHQTSLPDIFDRDYLRHELETQLKDKSCFFTLKVQLQEQGDSIEDSTIPWRGPFRPLAELNILQVGEHIAESDGESLSFNPFRTLPEHEALGWPGRLRKAMYDADYKWRTAKNLSVS